MITGSQIRGARAMIGMSIEDLALASDLSNDAVEALENDAYPGESRALLDIKTALEARGVIFIASGNHDEGGPGVRLKARVSHDDGIRPEHLNAANDD